MSPGVDGIQPGQLLRRRGFLSSADPVHEVIRMTNGNSGHPNASHGQSPDVVSTGPGGHTPVDHLGSTIIQPASSLQPTLLAPADGWPAEMPETHLPRPRIGDYEILGEIGRGGMGVVFRARQVSLNRVVALKMILSSLLATSEDVRRFRSEAEAAGKLDHPGIMPVFEFGESQGQHYLAMGLVEGGSLADLVKAGPLSPKQAAQLVQKIADAVHYAHSRNIVHRDLKPANVLLDRDGNPKVTDFGLAKDFDVEQSMTATGAIMGTPSFMSPEQAGGRNAEIGPLVDVYALGAILYFLLTGRPPFRGQNVAETLQLVLTSDPVSPRQFNRHADPEINTICLKCLEKNAAARYPSAAHLSEELGRYLVGEPILARPITWMERVARWTVRRPAVAAACTLGLATVVLLALGGIFYQLWVDARAAQVSTEQARQGEQKARHTAEQAFQGETRAKNELQQANAQLDQALQQLAAANERLDRNAYIDRLNTAQQEFTSGNVRRAHQILTECSPKYRGWEWRHLNLAYHQHEVATLGGHTGLVHAVACSRDGRRIATAGVDASIRLWDAEAGELLAVLTGHPRPVVDVEFSADGTRLVSMGHAVGDFGGVRVTGDVRVWDVPSGTPLATIPGVQIAPGVTMSLSPDGSQLAVMGDSGTTTMTGSTDNTVRRIDMLTGQTLPPLQGHSESVMCVAYSPDGKMLASGSWDQTAKLWNPATGELVATLSGHSQPVSRLAFSPAGDRLATSCSEGTVRVWDVDTRDMVAILTGLFPPADQLLFSPNGRQLLVRNRMNIAQLWNIDTGTAPVKVAEMTEVSRPKFSPDGTRLSSDGKGDIRVWDTTTGREATTMRGHVDGAFDVCFSPDGRTLASASPDNTVRLWDASSGKSLAILAGHASGVYRVAFHPAGTRLVSAGFDGTARVWETDLARQVTTLSGHTQRVGRAVLSPDGKWLASGSADKTVCLWDMSTGELLARLPDHPGPVYQILFQPDKDHPGKLRLLTGAGREVRHWELPSGKLLATFVGEQPQNVYGTVLAIALSPDGQRLAVSFFDSKIRLWDLEQQKLLNTLHVPKTRVERLAFSPDGMWLAAGGGDSFGRGGGDGIVWLWRTSDGEPVQLAGHQFAIQRLCFSPDGSRLASAGADATVRLWNINTGETERVFSRPAPADPNSPTMSGWIHDVVFNHDGTLLATASADLIARIWDARTGQLLHDLAGHSDQVRRVTFSPDGRRLASAAYDGTVRLWDVSTGRLLTVLPAHHGGVLDVCFDPQGSSLITAGGDASGGSVRLWHDGITTKREQFRRRTRPAIQARDAETKGDWFPAVFWLQQLAQQFPDDAAVAARLAAAQAEWNKSTPLGRSSPPTPAVGNERSSPR